MILRFNVLIGKIFYLNKKNFSVFTQENYLGDGRDFFIDGVKKIL